MKKLKALLHIDEIAKWPITLANTKNFITDVGLEHVIVEIVANGAAVRIFDSNDENMDQDTQNLLKQFLHFDFTIGLRIDLIDFFTLFGG